MRISVFLLLLCAYPFTIVGQTYKTYNLTIVDSEEDPISSAIVVFGPAKGVEADSLGRVSISVPVNMETKVIVSCPNCHSVVIRIAPKCSETEQLIIQLISIRAKPIYSKKKRSSRGSLH